MTASDLSSMPPLILVDGSAYLYRAYHAMPELSAPDGAPTGAIFGVLNMLHKLRKNYSNSPFALIFDAKGGSFRQELDANYKAHRKPMPDALKEQIAPLHACIKALGFKLLCVPNVEADDVIGTLAVQFKTQMPVLICSGDKDMAQLVDEQVSLYDGLKDVRLTASSVQEKFGVPPSLIIDFLALMGDKADNIPGVSGIGNITAQKLLNEIGNLDVIYQDLTLLNKLKLRGVKSVINKLAHEKSAAYLSRQLATIKTDVDLNINLADLTVQAPDIVELSSWYQKLGFNKWLRDLNTDQTTNNPTQIAPQTPNLPPFVYNTIFTEEEFNAWLNKLEKAEIFAFDLETTSLDAHQAQIVGIALAIADIAVYIPLTHSYPDAPKQLDATWVLSKLKPLLENPNKAKVAQNGKYDMNVFAHATPPIMVQGLAFDSMLESHLLNATATKHDLDSLAAKYLNYQAISFADVAGKGAKQLNFSQVAITDAAKYAAEDAYLALHLHHHLWAKLSEHPAQAQLLQELEMPLVPVIAAIEQQGVLINRTLLEQQSSELGAKLEELQNEAFILAGEEFNLASPKQLGQILYQKLGLPIPSATNTGQASTNESALSELAANGHKLPQILLQYRTLSKLKSTYTDKLPQQINPNTGRIHTNYHQTGAATGRMSSSDPNLQNIPIRTPEGRKIRQAFIAPNGYKILAADYSQIELRVMAHMAGDEALIAAFAAGEDIHKATAAQVFNTPLAQVTNEQRRSAKAINFGLIYGMSAFGLARQLEISRNEAAQYIESYFAQYQQVAKYIENIRNQAKNNGFVSTLFGRKLHLPNINSSNRALQQGAIRAAINAPIQGTAADIIKRAMLTVFNWLKNENIDASIIMQVHDELVIEVKDADILTVSAGLKHHMSLAASLSVPLVVDIGIGLNWDEAH